MAEANAKQAVRAIAQKIYERIATDSTFRKQVIANPDKALATSGFEKELIRTTGAKSLAAIKCGPHTCLRTCNATCKRVTCPNGITEVVKK
jgi:hypothetical protein